MLPHNKSPFVDRSRPFLPVFILPFRPRIWLLAQRAGWPGGRVCHAFGARLQGQGAIGWLAGSTRPPSLAPTPLQLPRATLDRVRSQPFLLRTPPEC